MGYVSDWDEWAEGIAAAQAAHPDCTQAADCPADEHLLTCRRFRRERREAHRSNARHNG